MGLSLGSDDYREGALERLQDAVCLGEQERWTGAVYLAGRAAEAMLRSLLWLKRREQEIGHDLRDVLKRAQSLGLLGEDESQLQNDINEVAVIWQNNLRFVGSKCFGRHLRAISKDKRVAGRRVKGDPLKPNAKHMIEICESIVARGDVVWHRYKKRSIRS